MSEYPDEPLDYGNDVANFRDRKNLDVNITTEAMGGVAPVSGVMPIVDSGAASAFASVAQNTAPNQFLYNGQLTITGTATPLNSAIPCSAVIMQADSENEVDVSVGDSNGQYLNLKVGDVPVEMPVSKPSTIYCAAADGSSTVKVDYIILSKVDYVLTNANAVIEFNAFPASGVTITNTGTGSATYKGTSTANYYQLLANGNTAWAMPHTENTYVEIPAGAAVNNIANLTVEATFIYHENYPRVNSPVFFQKQPTQLYIANNRNAVVIQRGTANSGVDQWVGESTDDFTVGEPTNIQVTWAFGSGVGNAPGLRINGNPISVTHEIWGGGAWQSDAASGIYISGPTDYFYGTLAAYRVHNVILTSEQLTGNSNVDLARFA
jgi:hypothetical protein